MDDLIGEYGITVAIIIFGTSIIAILSDILQKLCL